MNHELACQEEPRERVSMFRVLSIPNLHELAVATLILANPLTPGVTGNYLPCQLGMCLSSPCPLSLPQCFAGNALMSNLPFAHLLLLVTS